MSSPVTSVMGSYFTLCITYSVPGSRLNSMISCMINLFLIFFSRLVNGGYTEWNSWTPCSVTCGRGIKKRQRFCTNPEPAYGGVACGHLGSGEEIVQCYDVNCPGECLVN